MADNFQIRDNTGAALTIGAKDASGVLLPRHRISDGTNDMPSGDATARGVYVRPTDGTNDIKSGSAANIFAQSSINSVLTTFPGEWSVTHAPAVNTQATASKSAGAAGVRHVITGVAFTLCQDTTGGTPYTGTVNLRDGASNAGTILATWYIGCPTAPCTNSNFSMSGLNLVGSAATAATLEFTAAGGARTLEAVTLMGYDCV